MVSAHAYPTFDLSDAVPLWARTAARQRKLGPCPEIPYCPEIPSLTLISCGYYNSARAAMQGPSP